MAAMSNLCLIFIFGFSLVVQIQNSVAAFDYGSALTKSLLFFEAQRSGKLPSNQRANWRGNSALKDGWDAGANLVGGYYDAGDNLKFGFPMAYTMTMLAWSVVEFGSQLRAQHEFSNALAALKWGTDYLIKAHPWPEVLYGQVGEGVADHACWQRPEDMTTPRTVYMIDDKHPGSDLAGETAAALAAAAVAFQKSNPSYASELIKHAKQLFEFATYHRGLYTNTIPAGQYYQSSGDADELLWAAAWLRQATNDNKYLEFIKSANSGGARDTFSWDDKYVGAHVLITKDVLQGKIPRNGNIDQMKKDGEEFVCNCMQKGNKNVRKTNGGVLWFSQWNNLQYVTSASFILTTYANILTKSKTSIQCSGGAVWPKELLAMAKSQVDYILGDNPKGMSYMVGYGSNYPKQVHHRAASIVSMKKNAKNVGCQEGFDVWFHRRADNPNVLEGAIVGGPDESDQYKDERENYQQAEPATANNAPIVGVLASLATWNKF